ncbi:twin-arginine translocase TatA/TatE family subunit [Herbiconiux sp. VKM Ac-1786]|uniref:twin-arginine translocase TatA/TatE family subunit n=1 Tax=Herbiconiux sp. VKM Ac-1786 TaxID=2783824 RepID=UPI00188AFD99|nr:twin-arginine translocase TatA/TatE family subunit [Herbiconiux sp. VKM Ac-1786]MBF4572920.1 twin-arginine translocase TatA/TatE family subunit [Herbiconiux sp. VKM Ac-1786]
MLGNLNGWHLIVVLVVILLLFGATRLPALSKGLAQSMRIFKQETKGLRDDDKPGDAVDTTPPAPSAPSATTTDVAPPLETPRVTPVHSDAARSEPDSGKN